MDNKIYAIRRKILSWYRKNKRDLPWRKTKDPYAILVSEVMLQQTQVLRVLPKYATFIKAYPTVDALANSSLGDVLKLWSGLGYNRRAKYLKQMAEMVKNGYNGQIPNTYEELRKLPGIGEYTANAVLCFAFGQKRPAVDTNVRNVIEQSFQKKRQIATPRWAGARNDNCEHLSVDNIKELVLKLMPDDRPDEFLHALMDYSSLQLARPKRYRAKSISFKLSNRFLRGRLISKLTQKPYRIQTLINEVQDETERSRDDVKNALLGLLKERLVAEKNDIVTLPSSVSPRPEALPDLKKSELNDR